MYQNTEHKKVIFGVEFTNVGSNDGILLNDIQGEFVDEDNIQVSYTSDAGKTKLRDYYYFTAETLGEDGWYDEDYAYIGDSQRLAWGQGAWFQTANDPKNLTTSGEVKKGHKIHAVSDPKTLVCSYYPTAFAPNAANVTWSDAQDEDNIQVFFTQSGKTKLRDYYYFTEGTLGVDGWYDEDYALLDADFNIAQAGEGFWYIPVSMDATFTEVSPLGDEEIK